MLKESAATRKNERDYSPTTTTVGKFYQLLIKNGENSINLFPSYQRGGVWNIDKQRKFISESLYGRFDVPAEFYLSERTDNGNYLNCIDGKQKSLSIIMMLESDLKFLDCYIPYVDSEGEEQVFRTFGKTFKELPEYIKDQVKSTELTYYKYRNLSLNEEREIFLKINDGVTVNKAEIEHAKYQAIFSANDDISKETKIGDFLSSKNSNNNRFVLSRFLNFGRFIFENDISKKSIKLTPSEFSKFIEKYSEKIPESNDDFKKVISNMKNYSLTPKELSKTEFVSWLSWCCFSKNLEEKYHSYEWYIKNIQPEIKNHYAYKSRNLSGIYFTFLGEVFSNTLKTIDEKKFI